RGLDCACHRAESPERVRWGSITRFARLGVSAAWHAPAARKCREGMRPACSFSPARADRGVLPSPRLPSVQRQVRRVALLPVSKSAGVPQIDTAFDLLVTPS